MKSWMMATFIVSQSQIEAFTMKSSTSSPFKLQMTNSPNDDTDSLPSYNQICRRSLLQTSFNLLLPLPSFAKCTDIESCREIGERKIEKDRIENPITKLTNGVQYKILQTGLGESIVSESSSVELIFSVSTLSGGYMYSRGFGFEKIDIGNGKLVKDSGLDSIVIKMGQQNVPIGIEKTLVGMKKGERRRVELPPNQGLITSNWQPEPTTRRGKAGLEGYKRMVEGTAGTPAFPAATIWDIEVLRIKK